MKRYRTMRVNRRQPVEVNGVVLSAGESCTVRVWNAGVTLPEARKQADREEREIQAAKRRCRKRVDERPPEAQ